MHLFTCRTLPNGQGMVDAGEQVSLTLKREFGEEALNTLMLSSEEVTTHFSA